MLVYIPMLPPETVTRAALTTGYTGHVSRGPRFSGRLLKIVMKVKFKIKAVCVA